MSEDYMFSKSNVDENARLRDIEKYFDPRSRELIFETGIGEGWTCLEVGPGAGSIMEWMGEQVGESGLVIGLDNEPKVPSHVTGENVKLRTEDIRESKLDDSRFNLIHGRFVLQHLPDPETIVENLVAKLESQGYILFKETDHTIAKAVGNGEEAQAVNRVFRGLARLCDEVDPYSKDLGIRLPGIFENLGLEVIDVDVQTPIHRGNTLLADIFKQTIRGISNRLRENRVCSESDLLAFDRWLSDEKKYTVYPAEIATTAKKT